MRNLNDKISANFTYKEFINSTTANRLKIDNSPTSEVIWTNLEYLVENCVQPARDHFKTPININSGYRSPALNKAVKGSSTSFHSHGCAADLSFTSASKYKLIDLFSFFYNETPFTELIAEELGPNNAGWIHVAIQKGREKEKQLKYKLVGKPVVRASYETIMKDIMKIMG